MLLTKKSFFCLCPIKNFFLLNSNSTHIELKPSGLLNIFTNMLNIKGINFFGVEVDQPKSTQEK